MSLSALQKDIKAASSVQRAKTNMWFFKTGEEQYGTFEIVEILLHDKHDLIQKAVGWMLREVGKRVSQKDEETFLKRHYKTMPRTMLRYAIERFDPAVKKKYMLGTA